jgi:hypothetical protein
MANAFSAGSATLLEKRLIEAANELDVPPSMQEAAERAYRAVGEWLNGESSPIAAYRPEVYPQGSFALGTAIRPLGDCDYDVDAVCELATSETAVTQQQLKSMVGDRLKEHGTYAGMLEPREGGRRCWTLRYAEESKFHLDVLPAVPADHTRLISLGVRPDWARTVLAITDKLSWTSDLEWPKTNPKGYAAWFKERTIVRSTSGIVTITAGVEQLPDSNARTSLQRAVQLLKRHRDVHYGADDDKPISIIITTLAARAYTGQVSLEDTLHAIVPAMRSGFELRNGVVWVPNPVNPEENFADKWAESARKKELFVEWLVELERDLDELARERRPSVVEDYVRKAYRVGPPAAKAAAPTTVAFSAPASVAATNPSARSRFDVAHRATPPWTVRRTHVVDVRGRIERNGRWVTFRSGDGPLPKRCALQFDATTDVPQPFNVFWQVVNTGAEAAAVENGRGLRGQIRPASNASRLGLTAEERTLYKGHHWIECFVVKDGVCVAHSGEFVVNVG